MSDTAATGAPEDILDTGEAGGRAIRGGALFTGAYVAGLLMSLASVPFMIRHLGVVDYGFYVSASAFIFIIGGFTEAGLTNLGIREYAHLPEHEREPFLRHLIGLRLVLTSVGVVVATGVAALAGSPGAVVAGVAISGLALLIGLTQQTFAVPLTVQLRMGWISVIGLTRQALLSVLVIAFVLAGFGLIAFFWATVIQSVLVCALTIALVRGTAPLLPAFDGAAWRRILHDTVAYALAAAVGLIYFRTAAVLLLHVSSEHETGIFSAAFRIVEVLVALPWMLVAAGFPILSRAARDDEARLGYALQRIFEVSTVLGVAISLGLCVGAPFAIDVVAGPGFKESIPVLQWQSLGLVTSFLMVTWTYALLSLKLYGPLLRANGAAAVVAVVAVIVLGGQYGAEGAAIATVLAEAVLAGGSLAALIRHRPNLRPDFTVIWKVLVAVVVAVAVALLVPAPSLVLALLAGGVYGVIVLLLKAVPPEVMTALLRRA